jgi:hypothetical protein
MGVVNQPVENSIGQRGILESRESDRGGLAMTLVSVVILRGSEG